MLERENFLGDKLAQLLCYDVLFGIGVRGKFKGTMKRNYASLTEALEHYMTKHQVEKREDLLKMFEDSNESAKIQKPKYIYLNTLVHTKKELIAMLKADNFTRVKNSSHEPDDQDESTNSQIDFKSMLQNLKNVQYFKDNHVKNMIIFSPDSLLNKNYKLFQDGHLMQIDKVK